MNLNKTKIGLSSLFLHPFPAHDSSPKNPKNHQTALSRTSPNILEFFLHQPTTNSELKTYNQILQILFVEKC